MCSQAIHRRIELVPLEEEEVGNVAVESRVFKGISRIYESKVTGLGF